jgi:hypothetical protein
MLNALKVFCDKLKVVGTYFNNWGKLWN